MKYAMEHITYIARLSWRVSEPWHCRYDSRGKMHFLLLRRIADAYTKLHQSVKGWSVCICWGDLKARIQLLNACFAMLCLTRSTTTSTLLLIHLSHRVARPSWLQEGTNQRTEPFLTSEGTMSVFTACWGLMYCDVWNELYLAWTKFGLPNLTRSQP